MGTAGVSTWATRSSARLVRAISTARAKAAPDALEKSVGCRMRRILLIAQLLSSAPLLQDPDLFGQDHVTLSARVLHERVSVSVNTHGAPLEALALPPDRDPAAREDVALAPGGEDRLGTVHLVAAGPRIEMREVGGRQGVAVHLAAEHRRQ